MPASSDTSASPASTDSGSTWAVHSSLIFDDSNNSAAHLGGTEWRGTWTKGAGNYPVFHGRFSDSGVSPDPIAAGSLIRCYVINLTGTSLFADTESKYELGGIYSQPNPQRITPVPAEAEVAHPVWMGYKGTQQSVNNATWTIMNTYTATQYRGSWEHTNESLTYNYWVIPRAGFYHFTWELNRSSNTNALYGAITVNDATTPTGSTHFYGYHRGTSETYLSSSGNFYANAGDKIYLWTYQEAGVAQNIPNSTAVSDQCDFCLRHVQD